MCTLDLDNGYLDQGSPSARDLDALACRTRDGDPDARDRLYGILERTIRRFTRCQCRHSLPNGYNLDDMFQEAYLCFHEITAEWRYNHGFYPYFLKLFPKRLARRVGQLSRRWRRIRVEFVDHNRLMEMLDGWAADEDEDELAALEMLERLPDNLRRVARRRLVERMPLTDVAREMGIHRKTAANWAESAVAALRDLAGQDMV